MSLNCQSNPQNLSQGYPQHSIPYAQCLHVPEAKDLELGVWHPVPERNSFFTLKQNEMPS